MKISIFGTGYVGLISSVCLAEFGHEVICADINADIVQLLSKAISPIYEPKLDSLLKKHLSQNNIEFTTDIEYAIRHSEVLIIAVGTPSTSEGNADISQVLLIANNIANTIKTSKLILIKSTVPVGTNDQITELIKGILIQKNNPVEFHVCSNPEFLKEGNAIEDFFFPDRIIIGTNSKKIKNTINELYCYPPPFTQPLILFMEKKAAEFTKYVANAMLATKISFINEIANIAEHLSVNINEIQHGVGTDKRIGFEYLNPGCGYGGSCLPKDVKALIYTAKQHGYRPKLIEALETVNNAQKQILFYKLSKIWQNNLKNKTIALWGVSFKPETNDIREASSLYFIDSTLKSGANIKIFDPIALNAIKKLYKNNNHIYFANTPEDALKNADTLVICTEWSVFEKVPAKKIKDLLKYPIIIDGRNILNQNLMSEHGLLYLGIGKNNIDINKININEFINTEEII